MANGVRLSQLRRAIKKESVIYSREDLLKAWYQTPALKVIPFTLDREEYVGLPQGVWDTVLIHLGIHKFSYQSDRSDCDDFALSVRGRAPLELKANGVGAVFDSSSGHAYNAFLIYTTSRPIIRFVEPQAKYPSTWWIKKPGENGLYDLDSGYVFF